MSNSLQEQFDSQQFSNDYQLVNGVNMHTENPENFHIPPPVIKRHIRPCYFVELRIDSSRFSVHEDAAEKCSCPSCNGEMTNPILKHDHPSSLLLLPEQNVPSRGWGEDFLGANNGNGPGATSVASLTIRSWKRDCTDLARAKRSFFPKTISWPFTTSTERSLCVGMDVDDIKELAQWVGKMRRME